jgi:hypothetical protein
VLDTLRPELVTEQLNRIVTGPPLAASPSLCRFLRFVVEETLGGRQGSLKEYSLGVVVFERGDEFDPRLDPIVRVQARNLRVRLAQYYAGPGKEDPVVIDLPKRTYVPIFRKRIEAIPDAPSVQLLEQAAAEALETLAELTRLAEPPVDAPAVVSPELPSEPTQPVSGVPTAWPRPRWAAIVAAVVLAILGTTAFWRIRPAETARKSVREPVT